MKLKGIKVFTIIFILFILSSGQLYAYYNINFKNINNQDGLSQSTVETIIQDKNGYIWIGTNDGLNRYNGYDFDIFKHDNKLENSIINNYIVDLQEDQSGNIWVGTVNGLSKINTEDDKITNYLSGESRENLSDNNIGDILITQKGDILIGTSNGLNIYDKKNDKFKRILGGQDDLTNQLIYCLEEDINGDIWIGTKDGLNKVDVSNKKVYKFYSGDTNKNISGNKIYELYSDRKGYIWAGTFEDGLNKININTHNIEQFRHEENNLNSIAGNYIRDILRDSNDILWIATEEGLCRYNENEGKFDVYRSKPYDSTTLINDEVFTLIEDSSGLIWVGTYGGISIFDSNNKIKHYKREALEKNTLSENAIHGIYEDKDGLIWVGTNSKGLNIIDRKKDKISIINRENTNKKFSSNAINVVTGKDNEIYIGTNNGVNIIDKDKNTLKVYSKLDGLSENKIMALRLDNKGYLWIGTPVGVDILNLKNNKIISLNNILKNYSIENLFVREIYQDSEGIYWIGSFTDDGLIKINPINNQIKVYKSDKKNKYTISSDTIRSIKEDDIGNIWIGTSYGLNKLDKDTEKFTRYTTEEGLSNNVVYGILIDKNNNPWTSTNKGVSKLNIKTNTFENFGITDGFQGNEFNGSAYYQNNKDEFFFGGINGLNIFNPDDVDKIDYTPKVRFDKFEINGQVYKNINNLKFKYNENLMNIEVSIPDYRNMENIKYMYILEGTTDRWHSTESNIINYSSLPPGNYKLKIKARGHTGVISDENSLKFKITPPLYKSKIAIIFYIIIILLIIYFYINRMKHLDFLVRKRTEELNNEMQKNTDLLNKIIDLERNKNNYFVNLSHELRTPLNVIYSTQQLISDFNHLDKGITKEKIDYYMDVINRNTKRLLNLINNIIDTTKIEHGNYKINLNEDDIVSVVENAALSLKDYVEGKGIELIIDPEVEEKLILCDSYEIERCIVNLVSNSAKFTPKGGTIKVVIKEKENNTIISVEDNGIGIDPKYHKLIFDRFKQANEKDDKLKGGSGLGLSITRHIIELHNGKIYVESELNKGTKFTIIL